MKKRKGSALLASIMCFSLSSVISIALLGLTIANYDISKCEYEYAENFYMCEGGIDIAHGQIKYNIEEILTNEFIENDTIEKIFTNYFLGNDKGRFISSIENIKVENLILDVKNDYITLNDNIIKFDLISKRKNNKTEKQMQVTFNIFIPSQLSSININELINVTNYMEIK